MVEKEPARLLFNQPDGKLVFYSEAKYADQAKDIMKKAHEASHDGSPFGLTTTKLRGIYANIANLSTKIVSEDDFAANQGDIQYLKVKMAYEAGRTKEVKIFLDETHLLDMLDHLKTYDQFVLYCRYAESLVVYFKFFGGKE